MIGRIAAVWLSWVMVFSFVVIIIEIADPVSGTTITVDDSGGADFFTITMAINVANDGDTVYVYSGTYYEHVVVYKTINLTGENRDTTIIDGQGFGDVVSISANWMNISGFTVRNSGPNGNPRDAGIEVNNAHNATISDSKFTDNRVAIYKHNSNYGFVTNNIVDDFEGIHVELSRNITITGNILSNDYYGIYLDSSTMAKITNNTMTGDGLDINGNSTEYWNTHDIDTSNTLNGNPVFYWKNQNAGTVPSGAGQVILANCTNVKVENQEISDSFIGIILGYSYNNLINNNNASSNHDVGMKLYYSNNNTIENNTFIGNMDGISFVISNGNNITGNQVLDNAGGMIFSGSDVNIITDNIFSENAFGLMLVLADGNNIIDNNFISNWAGPGIYIASSSNNIITKNILFENKEGINITDFFYNSSNNKVFHNSLISNINQAYDDTISGNSWDNGYPSGGNYWSDYTGIDDFSGPNQDLSGSDGFGDTNYSIDSDSIDNYPLMEPFGNETFLGPIYNIDKDTNYDTIQEAIDDADSGNSIFVYNGTYYENLIIDKTLKLYGEDRENTIINGSDGEDVILITAEGVTISNFTIIGSGLNESDAGIKLEDIQNCNINNNTISNSMQGIYVNNSNNNIISDNYISYNGVAIGFNSSIGNYAMDNVMIEDGIVIDGDSIEHWNSHEIDTSNTVNGKPVYYWKNKNSGTIPANAGQIILANCRNILIENQEITNTSVGIELGFSNDNSIRGNTVSSNIFYGLFLISSNKNTIFNNIISGNGISVSLTDSKENYIDDNQILDSAMGIIITVSDGNSIKGNNISNNDEGIWIIGSNKNIIEDNIISNKGYGIWLLFSNESSIQGNKITQHFHGIYMFVSDNNNISENIISNNIMGIYFWITSNWNNITLNLISNNSIGLFIMGFIFVNPENNSIYHNSFINNTNQSFDTSINGNKWDNGYPSGGNYWDDYTGIDTKSGPDQDISGYDGIGDTPYEMDSGTIDNYPLIKPLGEDFVPPSIDLISPSNNAVINPGIIIDFSISDSNLDKIMYSINEEPYQDLLAPYDLDTNYWEDGNYHIGIQAEDTSKNTNTASFNFIVDSTPPTISLNSPIEGSFIGSSPEISLTISDENLDEVLYSINSGNQLQLYDPYTIDGSGWPDGEITLTIYASDKAGNSKEKSFLFRKDNIFPQITLMSPFNESILMEFSTLDFDVSDGNLDSVSYSLNQGSFQTMEDPYDLDTLEWTDGEYKITIKAEDTVGNIIEKWFIFRKDTTPPSIDSSSINDNDVSIEVDSQIIIEFSESMDTESVESAISISPFTEYSSSWSTDNKTLTITCNDLMDYETRYQVSISTKAKDMANRGLEDAFEIEFTTQAKPKGEDGEGFPVLYLILTLLVVIILVVVILVMVMSKKKKAPVSGVDPGLLSEVVQTPQTMQITCSNCHNLLQVNDTGVTQNVTCPYCSTYLAVPSQIVTHAPQSQYPTQPQPVYQSQVQSQPQLQSQVQTQTQVQQPTQSITCPKCQYRFSVVKPQGPIQIQCPNCGVQGTLR